MRPFLKTCTSCKIQHYHILHFPFLRGFTAVFLFGELGVEGERNGLIVIYFVMLGKRGYLPIKTKSTKR
jgi:hypothetical protein